MDEDRQGVRVITAKRGYSRDEARLNVSLSVLPDTSHDTSITMVLGRSSARTGRPSTRISMIDGFQVVTWSTPAAVSIAVVLKPSTLRGMFESDFDNVSEDEALAIAQKFDWKGMRALLD